MQSFLQNCWETSLSLSPWLLLGALISGVVHILLPSGWVEKELQGKRGVIKAALVGLPLPLCSCGVIPAGIGLKKEGASNGASISFLISTPQTGLDSLFVSSSFLGWPFAIFKVISAFVLGIIGGSLTEVHSASSPKKKIEAQKHTDKKTWRKGFAFSIEVIQSIWRWIVFGVVISALIQTAFPNDAFRNTIIASSLFAAPLALFISIPMYVCTTASVPIAAALVEAGMPTSAALVFLMAGPATNLATIGTIRKTFGTKTFWTYLSTITLGSILLSYLFDFLISKSTISVTAHLHHESSWLPITTTLLLFALFLFFGSKELLAWLKRKTTSTTSTQSIQIPVEGISCGKCVSKIENELRTIEGVTQVHVTRNPDIVHVSGNPKQKTLRSKLRELDYPPIDSKQ